ncbi:MAG: TonB-dependent receptor [Bacteroidales bacterium]|nr:TonB-dependent receptor [Bacteroidales bacterium]
MVPKTYLSFLLFAIIFTPLFLQGQSLQISVRDTGRTPLTGATVQLQNTSDSTWHNRIADIHGFARFERLSVGFYNLRVSYIGFETVEKAITVNNDEQRFDIILREDAIALGEVTVTASRPLIRQEGDRMIIDPEPLASISTNTLEILESTPGLFVDQDGGIFLSSATPATILINGREQKMSNQDITTLLRSLPPSSVLRIEVMRTPSARYSASSSGGIINIVLRRGARIGRFGSITSGFNQGYYGNRFAGVSFNNGGDVISSYVNLNYNNNDGLEELNSARFLRPDTTLFQSARTRRQAHQAFAGYGLSFDPNERWSLNYDGRINGSLPTSNVRNNNLIATSETERISETRNRITNDSKFLNIQQDFGVRYRLDTLGSEWDTRLGYNFNRNDIFQDYSSGFIFPENPTILGDGDNDQQRHFVQLQSDLILQLPREVRLEAGVSSSWQDYDSRSDFRINLNGSQFPDPIRTNAFNYRERIHALYLQASRPIFAGITAKGGLRMENTFMEGNQTIPADTSFVVQRTDWFPYLYLSRPLFQIAGFEITSFMIYRRSINRPGYQSLNPYINYVDQFLYETGNPALKPQFTENYEFNISLNDMPIFAVGRNNTTDIFSSVIYRDPNLDNVAVRTFDNLGESTETYFRAIAGIPPGGRYFFALGAQYNHNEYNGFYEGEPLIFSRGSWRFFTFHMLRLGSNTRLTMSGFMMTRGQMNFLELGTFGQLNLGLNQTFLDRRLTVSLSARDVLRTMVTEFQLNQGSISTTGDRYADNQRFGINIRYNFGISDRQERSGLPDFDMVE